MRLTLLCLFLSGCANVSPFIVTGDSLDAVGRQYVETSKSMYDGCSKGKVELDTCRAWKDFSERFKPAFDVAVTGFKGAVVVNDVAQRGKVAATAAAIGGELAVFVLELQRLGLLGGAR